MGRRIGSAATRRPAVPALLGPWLSIVGGALMAVGSGLPWVNASGAFATSANGFQSARPLTFAAGPVFVVLSMLAITLGVFALKRPSPARYLGDSIIGTGLLALAPALLGWWTIHHVILVKIVQEGPPFSNPTRPGEVTSIGVGYMLCIVGLLITSVAGYLVLSASKAREVASLSAASAQ